MRFKKDSISNLNPRAMYWQRIDYTQRRYKILPFSIVRLLQESLEKTAHYFSVWYYHYNPMIEGLNMHRHRELKQIIYNRQFLLGACAFLVVSTVLHFETRLWKEKKWDEERGYRIPMRHRHTRRLFNQVVNVWVLPTLMYFGLMMENKDLDPSVDANQITGGRQFRRFLVSDYIRKQNLVSKRDSRYDFLELSPEHGKL